MEIIGIIIYIINVILGLFSLNIVIKYHKKIFIIVGLNYLVVSVLSLFYLSTAFLFEGLILLLIFGIPFILTNKTLPRYFTKDENNLIRLSLIPVICLWIIFFL
jgi:hypothetical protein